MLQQITDSAGIAITNGEIAEPVQANLLWLAGNVPSDVGLAGDNVTALANGIGVAIVEDDDAQLRVSGDYTQQYLDAGFAANGNKLSYGSTDSLVGVMDSVEGVQMLDYTADTITDTTEVATDENARSYTFMKPINGILYYGFEQASSTQAYLMYAATEEIIFLDEEAHQKIYILPRLGSCEDTDATGAVIHATKTLAYDNVEVAAYPYPWTVVAFEDDVGNIRYRLVYGDGSTASQRLDGNIWKSASEVNIKDIVIYHNNGTNAMNFAMLDDTNNKVWLGRYTTAGIKLIDESKAIDVGSNPVAMTYSAVSGKLYVLNRGEQTISVIPLMTSVVLPVRAPAVEETISLSSAVTGKTIAFAPNAMTLSNNKLLVTDETTKALVVIDVGSYETAL